MPESTGAVSISLKTVSTEYFFCPDCKTFLDLKGVFYTDAEMIKAATAGKGTAPARCHACGGIVKKATAHVDRRRPV